MPPTPPPTLVTRSYRSLLKLCGRYLDNDVAWRTLVSSAKYPGCEVDASIPKGRVKLAEKIQQANGGALWYVPGVDGHEQCLSNVVRREYRAGGADSLAVGFAALSYAAQLKAYATENVAPELPPPVPGAEALASRQLPGYSLFSDTESSAETWRKHLTSPDAALLLVAHPLLAVEPFQHTVILMRGVYPKAGMEGLIINIYQAPRIGYGGPVGNMCQGLAREEWADAMSEEEKAKVTERESLGGGICRIAREGDSEMAVEMNDNVLRLFGSSGWLAHQLRMELAEGTWLVAETTGDFSQVLLKDGPLAELDKQAFYTQVLLHMASEGDVVRQLARIRYADSCGIACTA